MVVVNATLTASTSCRTPATSARSPAADGDEDVRASAQLGGQRVPQVTLPDT